MRLSKKDILKIQKNRDPYLLMDYATKVIPGKSVIGFKILKKNEWFFKVHWPNDPNMPGMLQIEALVQMSALSILTLPDNKGKIMYLTNVNNSKFIKKIVPGVRFFLETKVKTFKRGLAICEGVGLVENQTACKAEFNLILPDQLKEYNLKTDNI